MLSTDGKRISWSPSKKGHRAKSELESSLHGVETRLKYMHDAAASIIKR